MGVTMSDLRRSVIDAALHKENEQGNVASFETNVSAKIPKLVAEMSPIQDLHGQSSPWPAGGGRNMLPFIGRTGVHAGVNVSYDESDQTYVMNGTTNNPGNLILSYIPPSQLPIQEDPSGCYIISAVPVSGSMTLAEGTGITFAVSLFSSDNSNYIRGDTTGTSLTNYYGRRTTGIASTGNYQLMLQIWRVGTVFNNFKIRVQIERGDTASSTPTAWSPYENICPISRIESESVTASGKNFFNANNWDVSSSNGITVLSSNEINVETEAYQENKNSYSLGPFSGLQIRLSCKAETISLSDSRARLYIYGYTDRGVKKQIANLPLNSVGFVQTISEQIQSDIVRIVFGGWAYVGKVNISQIQLEFDDAESIYTPYIGSNYSVTFPSTTTNIAETAQWNYLQYGLAREITSEGSIHWHGECTVNGNPYCTTYHVFKLSDFGLKTGDTVSIWCQNGGMFFIETSNASGNQMVSGGGYFPTIDPNAGEYGTYTIVNGDNYFYFAYYVGKIEYQIGDVIDETCKYYCSIGDSFAGYEPYIPKVYGGTFDFASGNARAGWDIVDMGSLDWSALSGYSDVFSSSIRGKANGSFNLMSSTYKTSTVENVAGMPDMSIVANTTGYGIFVKDSRFSDKDAFKTAVAGQTICYQLAVTMNFRLYPSDIRAMNGKNVVWSDKDRVTVDYWEH